VARREQWAHAWERRIAPPFRNYNWLHGYAVSLWRPPDLLLDETPGSLCGVEVAGRSSKGYAAFKRALDGNAKTKKTLAKPGKRAQLRVRTDVIEAYISLWCRNPMVSIWEQVKP
jgi:hypothetical protein